VFSELLKPDAEMQALIDRSREPYATPDAEKIATADRLLYRRGNFNGTVDQVICDALRGEFDAEIALSPGFRWGNTVMPGQPVTMEDVMAETLEGKIDSFERFDRLLASSEARRNNALREIERHRAALGSAVRQAIDGIQDAEFRDVDTGEVGGAPPS
jgi:hypothetical protein